MSPRNIGRTCFRCPFMTQSGQARPTSQAPRRIARCRALSARLLHDEAQSAPQREDGAAAGLRRPASAAAASTVQGALALIAAARHWLTTMTGMPRRRDVAQGRRAWRIVRDDGDQGRARGARRSATRSRAGAEFGAWHQSGHRGADRLHRRRVPASADGHVDAEAVGARSVPMSRRSC